MNTAMNKLMSRFLNCQNNEQSLPVGAKKPSKAQALNFLRQARQKGQPWFKKQRNHQSKIINLWVFFLALSALVPFSLLIQNCMPLQLVYGSYFLFVHSNSARVSDHFPTWFESHTTKTFQNREHTEKLQIQKLLKINIVEFFILLFYETSKCVTSKFINAVWMILLTK